MQANILVVDDTPENLQLLLGILKNEGHKVRSAPSGSMALESAQMRPPDLILLDIMMPEMNGFQVCQSLKADERTSQIPVIFISGLNEAFDKVKAFSAGGVDYITKPFHHEEVLARVRTHLTIREQHQLLQEQQARFQALSDAAFEGIVIHDRGQILDVNRTFERMFGCSRSELIGKQLLNFIPAEYHEGISTQSRSESDAPYEVQGLKRDGSVFPMEIQAKTMPYQGQNVRVDALRDLSRQKKMEAENEELHYENVTLKTTMKERYRFGELVGRSETMQAVYELLTRAAATEANVLISGESGTGKDLVAQTIHQLGKRKAKPFIPVNCGSIQETLFESEFFGHRKGAFTGALRDKPGFFDAAHRGTLFLDEIGELPLTMQVRLLRAIEGKGYTPVGAQTVKQADVRILAATNRNLQEQIKKGALREDFFYRINVITIAVPPLRERREDIPLLVEHFLKLYSDEKTKRVPAHVMEALYNRDWPGNIRQLQNVLQRYLTLKRLDFGDTGPDRSSTEPSDRATERTTGLRDMTAEFEKHVIARVLTENQGNRSQTARDLELPRRTLLRKMEHYHIS